MSYIIQHTCLGFCWLDLVALIVLIAVIVLAVSRKRKMKEQEKELEDQLSALYTDGMAEIES